ncbi:hypothetical protein DIE22_36445 [Burkholderia sp. Bp9142]|nr:hypothetical protein DIE22_36445 [Burkholderia sp. Bp9142]RQR49984.1 hypothetical protein DIE21_18425 [Burkholderia sp. Bp9140]
MRELDRFKVIQDVPDGKAKPWRAAERLGLTTRQAARLIIGTRGLVSSLGTYHVRFLVFF